MRSALPVFIALAISIAVASGCSRKAENQHEYTLDGQVLSVTADHTEANVKHGEIKGFMPAMTMPYKVKDAKEFAGVAPGDLIHATLVVVSNDAYLQDVKKTGQAPLEAPPPDRPASSASSGFELLKEGQPIPSAHFIDQDGKKRQLLDFAGKALVITFIYTRCPMPTFCPLMDRNFVELQDRIKQDPELGVRLLTVTFDPDTDTPAVLKKHGEKLGFNPKIWSFLTGNRDEIDQFAARFGVSVARSVAGAGDITHNLRTAIADRQGNLVKVYIGNEWTPAQIMADIQVLVGVD